MCQNSAKMPACTLRWQIIPDQYKDWKQAWQPCFLPLGSLWNQNAAFLEFVWKKENPRQKTAAVINSQATESNWPIQRGHPGVLVREQIDDASLHDPWLFHAVPHWKISACNSCHSFQNRKPVMSLYSAAVHCGKLYGFDNICLCSSLKQKGYCWNPCGFITYKWQALYFFSNPHLSATAYGIAQGLSALCYCFDSFHSFACPI